LTERWSTQKQPWPIVEDDECKVMIGTETVITGYVDVFKSSYRADTHNVVISGRDKAEDLVDCSANIGQWEFNNVDVYKLAKRLCDPHGIHVAIQPGLKFNVVPKISISVGETSFNVLEQACRLAGILAVSDGDGEITLTAAADSRSSSSLVEGQNARDVDVTFDKTGRFAEYIILGQHASSDAFFGPSATQIKARAKDPGIKRSNRVLIIQPEANMTLASAQRRVNWEATVRAARAMTLSCTVQGWTEKNGSLWAVNSVVPSVLPTARIKGDMLITGVTYGVADGEGTTTELQLKRPDAFDPEPIVKPEGLWRDLPQFKGA
jgi:prophage tail gpP-like protein